ncbi:MAG: hypothetical protein A2283_11255 [Lentisphaerae bacterium RIFOXYA12_FULL_48_11]|nr:MAG: hypothetical protein A2283_11255 [Lentisphaerae bacterium RIFOXYA12_FULL_48_11]
MDIFSNSTTEAEGVRRHGRLDADTATGAGGRCIEEEGAPPSGIIVRECVRQIRIIAGGWWANNVQCEDTSPETFLMLIRRTETSLPLLP